MVESQGTKKSGVAVDYLRQRIISGDWPVNSRIPTEPELSKTLGVGRSSVREAVQALTQFGMLEPAPSRGTFVRSRTPVPGLLADVMRGFPAAELLAVRRAIEVEAARRAALSGDRATLDLVVHAHAHDEAQDGETGAPSPRVERGRAPGHLHSLIVEMAGVPALSAVYAGVLAALRTAIGRGELVRRETREDRLCEHGEIIAALVAGDSYGAQAAMARHADRDLAAVEPGEGEPPSGG